LLSSSLPFSSTASCAWLLSPVLFLASWSGALPERTSAPAPIASAASALGAPSLDGLSARLLEPPGDDDCLFVIEPETGTTVKLPTERMHPPHLDILPGKCPNVVHVGDDDGDDDDDDDDHGVAKMLATIRISVLGNSFDVTQVDVGTVRLSRVEQTPSLVSELVAPVSFDFHDRGTPFDGLGCECTDAHGDGILDLNFRFGREELIQAFDLANVPDGTPVRLRISGRSPGGIGFRVTDCLEVDQGDGHGHGNGALR
jgi:hypothetical protein